MSTANELLQELIQAIEEEHPSMEKEEMRRLLKQVLETMNKQKYDYLKKQIAEEQEDEPK